MDYYLLAGDVLLVEEFTYGPDHVTVALSGAMWSAGSDGWSDAGSFGRLLRTNEQLLATATPITRDRAERIHLELSGGALPTEAALRGVFGEVVRFANAAPLRLSMDDTPDGFQEKRIYRVLFAKEPRAAQLAELSAAWRGTTGGGMPSGNGRAGDHLFTWNLRRVGQGIAWGLDVTVLLGAETADITGTVLRKLTADVRRQGLVPLTTERFA
ncbi:hypothetical protein ACWT_4291 [Actinoplanes sp. SE50]|uniref:hypothetical protein n=1 Tax=unclassified Actinoplanes TaxID=2626549 RepID=UPI00023EC657|nr:MULTISPECIES: hypothetical protein [unclassified Actinoplanes]AEV85311.1 hypothetical protein ACPL_4420 [Actinoplanes sp. SE50/110]ATO83706.1 hypothetical protein ACWT_4291 [Actinoplanes sp. SE50]SLM01114.1 hypothetical protein ACSP50_4347 [Actinoplanes sp. SE50/110]